MNTILVMGAGSWGTALALQLAYKGNEVYLHSWKSDHNKSMIKTHSNRHYLPGIDFPENLNIIEHLSPIINTVEYILIAVPSIGFAQACKSLSLHSSNKKIIIATKGFCHDTNQLLSDILYKHIGNSLCCFITGPSFAMEVAYKKPTTIVCASLDQQYAKEIQVLFSNASFRCYKSQDIIGVQIGAATKNIIAIAAGIIDGMQYGTNAVSGLITRSLQEIIRLGEVLGAQEKTFSGLSGLGDLILTCSDNQSRNRKFGYLIGKGETLKKAFIDVSQVVEGYHTVKIVNKIASTYKIDMPITKAVFQVLYENKTPCNVLHELMNRTLKSEF